MESGKKSPLRFQGSREELMLTPSEYRRGEVFKPHIGRDILRVSAKQDLSYLWRNSGIIITIVLRLAGIIETVLPFMLCR